MGAMGGGIIGAPGAPDTGRGGEVPGPGIGADGASPSGIPFDIID